MKLWADAKYKSGTAFTTEDNERASYSYTTAVGEDDESGIRGFLESIEDIWMQYLKLTYFK